MNIDFPLDGTARGIVQPVSKALFQSIYALELMLAIGRSDRFFQAGLAAAAGCQPNYAQQLMKRLETAGLIEPVPREPGQLRHYYRRLPSPIWGFCEDLAADLLAKAAAASQVTRLEPRQPESA